MQRAGGGRARLRVMRGLRWIAVAAVGLMLGLGVLALAARFSDGPIAILAGGPLRAGELATGPEPDWGFAREVREIELQLLEPPRSRTTWVLVHEGRLYVPCGYMTRSWGRWWKRWPREAERDGRAVVRIGGRRWERQAVRVLDPALFAALAAEAGRKYGARIPGGPPGASDVWFFELAPRAGGS